jgi:hypothetical protein
MSKKLNLCLHCGGQEVSFDDVINVGTPEATETWKPVSHELIIEQVTNGLTRAGLEVIESVHGLWKDGQRYFGLMQVTNQTAQSNHDDYSLVIGLRNSHDKSFPAALALGSGVFVCDNLAFSGEVKLARRHTKYIERDLPRVVADAIARLAGLRITQDERIETYKQHPITDVEAHDLVIRAIDSKVIGPTRVKAVLEEWRKPRHQEFSPRTIWSFFNAFTEARKPKKREGNRDNNNLITLPASTQRLHVLMDKECGLTIIQDETKG